MVGLEGVPKPSPLLGLDGLATVLNKVEEDGVWPEGLLDASIAMISKTDGGASPLSHRTLYVLTVVKWLWASVRLATLGEWFASWVFLSSVLLVRAVLLQMVVSLSGIVDSDVHIFVADVVKSFGTVERGVLFCVIGSMGLPAWFRHVHYEHHAHGRLRFKLACGPGPYFTGLQIPHIWRQTFHLYQNHLAHQELLSVFFSDQEWVQWRSPCKARHYLNQWGQRSWNAICGPGNSLACFQIHPNNNRRLSFTDYLKFT